MKKELQKILFWLLDEKHNLDSGICEQVTGRADKDYLLGLQKVVDKSSSEILSLFEKVIDSAEDEIALELLRKYARSTGYWSEIIKYISQIIKNKIKE